MQKLILFALFILTVTITTRAQNPDTAGKKSLQKDFSAKNQIIDPATVNQLTAFKKNTRQIRVKQVPKLPKAILIQSQPASIVEFSNSRKFEADIKTNFPARSFSQDCSIVPYNYTTSYDEMGLFFPSRNFRDAIFPGAVFQFAGIQNQEPVRYTRFSNRNPMDLTTTVFDPAVVPDNGPVSISNFDAGTLTQQYRNTLAKYPAGAAVAGAETDIFILESNTQLNADFHTAGDVNFAAKLNVPIPEFLVNIGIQKRVSVVDQAVYAETARNQNNTVIIRMRQVYYSAAVSSRAGTPDIFSGVDKSQLENDLVYVQSVDYGQVFYVAITSNFNKKDLYNAIVNKVSPLKSLGLQATNGNILPGIFPNINTMPTTGETNRIFNNRNTKISAFLYDGTPVNLGENIDEVLVSLRRKVSHEVNAATEVFPVSYTLNFVADQSPVWLNNELSYATANCGNRLENVSYNVSVELVSVKAPKVVEFFGDDAEDLYGELRMTRIGRTDLLGNKSYVFWSKKLSDRKPFLQALEKKETPIGKSYSIDSDLPISEISTSKLSFSGDLTDDNLIDAKYQCESCPHVVKLIDYIDLIEALDPDGNKFGSFPIFINFYENGDTKSSNVLVLWKILIQANTKRETGRN